MKRDRHTWARLIGAPLVLSALLLGCATQSAEFQPSRLAQAPVAPSAQPTQSGPITAEELRQLVAPIALYPDPLVGQILAASTNPAEIVEADRWIQQNSALKGQPLAQAVDQQSWDPSVKAMTQFPAVLAMMDQNLSWTSALGAAYTQDSQTVMVAVQAMRRRAQQVGNLKSTPQQSVTDEGQTIAIEPASPEVVYVPEYNPWLIYGAPIAIYPGWIGVPGIFLDAPGVYFGLGIGYFAGFGWGWHHWGADWDHHRVWHDHHPYVSRSPTFRGFDHGHEVVAHGGFGHASGIRTGAFGGFDHGGVVGAFSARGRASLSGGFHAGGVHAGGFHGGGGFRGGGHR